MLRNRGLDGGSIPCTEFCISLLIFSIARCFFRWQTQGRGDKRCDVFYNTFKVCKKCLLMLDYRNREWLRQMENKFLKYGKIHSENSFSGIQNRDSSIFSWGMMVNQVSLTQLIREMTTPIISAVAAKASSTPRSLLSHPSITREKSFSIAFERMAAKRMTAIIIAANDIILTTASDALIHWDIYVDRSAEKREPSTMPRTIPPIPAICPTNPFLIPL